MIRVVCIKHGTGYADEYVLNLQAGVERNLAARHSFTCFTDRPVEGITCKPLPSGFPGWWAKVGLFKRGTLSGPTLYFDLDCVIVGSIDWLVPYTGCYLAAMENWGSKPREGPLYTDEISSAVMAMSGSEVTASMFERFGQADIDRLHPHGDQTYITEAFRGRITPLPMNRILSYKRHCRGGLPDECPGLEGIAPSIVAFHGRPRPHELRDAWLLEHWRA